MIAIDTNLLVYAHRERTPQHTRARKAIERAAAAPRGWGMSAAVLPEFWSVVTHPSSEGRPSTPAQAAAFVRALTDAGALIWLPGPGFGERLLQTASALAVSGRRVFDLQIALAAFEGGRPNSGRTMPRSSRCLAFQCSTRWPTRHAPSERRPVEGADATKAEHHVVFLQNVIDELRQKVPLGK